MGHPQIQRAHGYINIVIADPSTKVPESSYSGGRSSDENSTEEERPVDFWNIKYGQDQEEVKVNVLYR